MFGQPNWSDFNSALPLDGSSLSPLVKSDHSQIICQVVYPNANLTVSAYNISNKEYHKYFTTNDSFKRTHLADSNPSSPFLLDKMSKQMDQILESDLDIQIIVEGYYDFFITMSDRINKTNTSHRLISVLDNTGHPFMNSPRNVIGILINMSKIEIISKGIPDGEFPWVHIKIKDRYLIILGIHLKGNESQFPTGALTELNSIISIMKSTYPTSDFIAMGDFNTTTYNVMSVLKNVTVIKPTYPTHMNPLCQVVAYDNTIYNAYNADMEISLRPFNLLPPDSNAFVQGLIERCASKI